MNHHQPRTLNRFGCNRRILIVGAPYTDWTNFRDALRNEGCDVQVITSGAMTLHQIMCGTRPDLVVLEIEAHKRDGFRLAHAIQAQGGIPIIGVSSFADEETVLQAIATFAEDFVVKPIYPTELMMRIRRVLLNSHRLAPRPIQACTASILGSENLKLSFA